MTKGSQSKWTVSYVKSAMEDITSLDGSAKKVIKKAIEEKLMVDPLKFGHPLKRSLSGLFKLRVGDYRIIYQIHNDKVLVVVIKVGHRREVYED